MSANVNSTATNGNGNGHGTAMTAAINILMVDDRPENLLALEAILRNARYNLIQARSGPEALEQLAKGEFGLILLDVQMPVMDGFETARWIRRDVRHRETPILFITALNHEPMYVFRGYEAGGIDYLTKPFDDHVLRAKVAAITELSERTRRIRQQEQALRSAHDQLEERVKERTAALETANRALQREIIEHQRVRDDLQVSLKEKEVLLREVHHRVKNNLQVISSLLSLQATYVQNDRITSLMEESQHRLRAMALVHEALYASSSLSQIDMSTYVRGLLDYLSCSYAVPVEIRQHIEPVTLGVDSAIPCGLILNELVTNALKHAFPDGRAGEISVELRAAGEDRFSLTVRDNGVGMPADATFPSTTSLGLRLVEALAHQLRGSVHLIRGHGTTFMIQLTATKPQMATAERLIAKANGTPINA